MARKLTSKEAIWLNEDGSILLFRQGGFGGPHHMEIQRSGRVWIWRELSTEEANKLLALHLQEAGWQYIHPWRRARAFGENLPQWSE